MVGFFAFAVLALFWVCFVWLVKREKGWVGITDYRRAMLRFTGKMILLTDQIGRALLPMFQAATKAAAAFNAAFKAEGWHLVGEPDEPPFENGWRNMEEET